MAEVAKPISDTEEDDLHDQEEQDAPNTPETVGEAIDMIFKDFKKSLGEESLNGPLPLDEMVERVCGILEGIQAGLRSQASRIILALAICNPSLTKDDIVKTLMAKKLCPEERVNLMTKSGLWSVAEALLEIQASDSKDEAWAIKTMRGMGLDNDKIKEHLAEMRRLARKWHL